MAQDNLFIVIEGIDGAGKTGIAKQLFLSLSQTHKDRVSLTYEPHDPSAAGLYIRNALTKRIKVSPLSLALAFALNRADHVDQIINPFFAAGLEPRIVISDRYMLSSLVYQSTGGLSMDDVYGLNRWAPSPDLTLFLDVSPHECYARLRNRPKDRELFEKNLAERAEKYRAGIQLLRDKGETIAVIDANPGLEAVFSAVLNALRQYAPDWLRIQPPLMLEVGAPREAHLLDTSDDDLRSWLNILTREMPHCLTSTEIDTLFKAYLLQHGMEWGHRLTDSHIPAYSLSCRLPPGIELQGAALLLEPGQHNDSLTKFIQRIMDEAGEAATFRRSFDFIILLDKVEYEPFAHFERDRSHQKSLSPQVQIVNRQTLLDWLGSLDSTKN